MTSRLDKRDSRGALWDITDRPRWGKRKQERKEVVRGGRGERGGNFLGGKAEREDER